MTIDTACSGSLVALHLACQALQAGECDGAVIGASNLFLSPDYALSLTRLGAIAADGQCKTFDASANGYGRGEGTNAVFVKRLSDAIRDGDNIRAIIRGTSSNRYVFLLLQQMCDRPGLLTISVLVLLQQSRNLRHGLKEIPSCRLMRKQGSMTLVRRDTLSVMGLVRLLGIASSYRLWVQFLLPVTSHKMRYGLAL